MSVKKNTDRSILAAMVIGSLILINIIGLSVFGRLDMTHDDQYTLSKASRDTLLRLNDPLTVRAYFTEDMPPPFSSNARYVRDLLDEYFANGRGLFRYEFIDPVAEETAEDKEKKKEVKHDIFGRAMREATSMERELQDLGIPAVQVRVNEDDKVEVKRAYMGLAIKYGDNTEVIPMVQETAGLEYDLTTLMRKVIRETTPKIGIITSHGGFDLQKELGKVHGLLTQMYEVVPLDLNSEGVIAEDIDAIIVVGPTNPFSPAQKQAIDSFVMSGRSAAFLLDSIKPDLQTASSTPANHGLGDLLASYGVTIGDGLVLDAECATISVAQQRGFMRIAQPVKYPYMPVLKALEDHPISRNLGEVAFPFSSPLKPTAAEGGDVKVEVIAKSSPRSWVAKQPYDLNPLQEWTLENAGSFGTEILALTLAGNLKSPYGQGPKPSAEGDAGAAVNARVMVAGGGAFITDQFLSPSGEALILNIIDWLILDDALLSVRSRGLSAAPIDEISDAARATVKYGNIFGLPLLFIGLGLLHWRHREARRGKVSI